MVLAKQIAKIDRGVIHFFRKHQETISRVVLFIIFGWFGVLKVLDLSPATPMVAAMFQKTLVSFLTFPVFLVGFGLFEVLIGILFLIRGAERIVFPLLVIHMLTTALPLFLLPDLAWTAPFVPTMEGQYIIKNLALIATAITIAAHLPTLKKI